MNFHPNTATKGFLLFFFLFIYSFSGISQTKSTHTYSTVNGQELMLDVYQPETISKNLPVLIWMHGGGFSGGSRDNDAEVQFMKEATKRNYIGVSISYRLLRKGEETGFGCDCPAETKRMVFREAAKDFWRALDFIYEDAEEFHIDKSKIVVGGSSAGAEAILNAIYLKDWVFEDKNSQEYLEIMEIPIAGVLSLAGALADKRYMTNETAVPGIFYHGIEDNLVPYETAPHHYCDPERPGYIWLDGGKTIYDRLIDMGFSSVLVTYAKGKHEISGIPFQDFDNLFLWFDQLFLKKQKAQIHIIREHK